MLAEQSGQVFSAPALQNGHSSLELGGDVRDWWQLSTAIPILDRYLWRSSDEAEPLDYVHPARLQLGY
jgi:hypothetical protein